MIELNRKKKDTDVKIPQNATLDSIESDLKMRWYKTDYSWIVTPYDRPSKDLKEVDPPECTCLCLIPTILFQYGGEKIAIYRKEAPSENLSYILNGTLMTDKKIRMHRGDSNRCHQNVSRLWLANPTRYRIVSGFAMDDTVKMWITHSWLLQKDGRIIETTFRFSLYFGTIMDDKSAVEFAKRHHG